MTVATMPQHLGSCRAVRCAADLARAYDDRAAAAWRGEPGGAAFGDWLGRCWRPDAAAPPGPPAAVSPCGGGGRGLRWYDAGGAVVGVVPGVAGGYRVPVGAVPPVAWPRPRGSGA
jgi:hypothetical protein